jgi:flagellar hook-basal body complex protein FliE
MTAIATIGAVTEGAIALPASPLASGALTQPAPATSFGAMLEHGITSMDAKIANADRLVAQFALDDSVPVHQVTIALEEARLSVEFAMQVRQRLADAYKELMNMQL